MYSTLNTEASTDVISRRSGHLRSPDPAIEGRVERIVQDPDGLGMRGLSGTRVYESRSIPLGKAGGVFRTEAGVEPRRAMDLAFTTSVVQVRHQLARFEGVDEDGRWCLLPDSAILYADGRRIIEECKSTWRQLDRDSAYVRRLRLVADEIAKRGWGFELHVAEAECDPVREDNVADMFPHRKTVYRAEAALTAAKVLREDGGTTTLGRLARAVADEPVTGRAVAYSMMADRLIDIDLVRQLSDNSPVRTVPRPVPDLPALRF